MPSSLLPIFEAWCESQGISVRGACITDFGGLRGVAATRALHDGEVTVTVPETALLSLSRAWADPAFSAAVSVNRDAESLPDASLFAAYLLHQASNPESKWRPYFTTLPKHYPIIAAFPDAVIDELQVRCWKDVEACVCVCVCVVATGMP